MAKKQNFFDSLERNAVPAMAKYSKPIVKPPTVTKDSAILLVKGILGLALAFLVLVFLISEMPCFFFGSESSSIGINRAVSYYFVNDVININLTMPTGKVVPFTGTMKDRRIDALRCGSSPGYDYWVSMGWSEGVDIALTKMQIQRFKDLLGEGRITVLTSNPENAEKLENATKTLKDGQEFQ